MKPEIIPSNQEEKKEEDMNDEDVKKRMIRGAELKQLQEQKRSGIEDPEDLPGENN